MQIPSKKPGGVPHTKNNSEKFVRFPASATRLNLNVIVLP